MTEFQVEFPVKLNGVIITKDVYGVLNDMQTNGTLQFDKPIYNNGGIADINEYIGGIYNYIIEVIACASLDESTEPEKLILTNLFWIRKQINYFKVPDEFTTNE